jgi:hypothetical protein
VNEVVILPEMLEAGVEAADECKKRKLATHDMVIAVYLAMRGIEEIAVMRADSRSVH